MLSSGGEAGVVLSAGGAMLPELSDGEVAVLGGALCVEAGGLADSDPLFAD